MSHRVRLTWAALLCGALCGCTRESIRVALEAQRRADEVHAAVVERQHAALCSLLFRDTLAGLNAAGLQLDPAAQQYLEKVWNERDLMEFWLVQDERARALRVVGVDAQLYGAQAIPDLLWKGWQARAARADAALADAAGAALATAGGAAAGTAKIAPQANPGGPDDEP